MEQQDILWPLLGGAIGTPLITIVLRRAFPSRKDTTLLPDELIIRRNESAYKHVTVLFLISLVAPLPFYELFEISEQNAWPTALGFLSAVFTPLIFLYVRHLIGGPGINEFLRYGELKEGVSRGAQLLLFGIWLTAALTITCIAIYQSIP